MTGFVLTIIGWIFYFAGLASDAPWDDRLNGVALGLFLGAFISYLIPED